MTPRDLTAALERIYPATSWAERHRRFAEATGYSPTTVAQARKPTSRVSPRMARLAETMETEAAR